MKYAKFLFFIAVACNMSMVSNVYAKDIFRKSDKSLNRNLIKSLQNANISCATFSGNCYNSTQTVNSNGAYEGNVAIVGPDSVTENDPAVTVTFQNVNRSMKAHSVLTLQDNVNMVFDNTVFTHAATADDFTNITRTYDTTGNTPDIVMKATNDSSVYFGKIGTDLTEEEIKDGGFNYKLYVTDSNAVINQIDLDIGGKTLIGTIDIENSEESNLDNTTTFNGIIDSKTGKNVAIKGNVGSFTVKNSTVMMRGDINGDIAGSFSVDNGKFIFGGLESEVPFHMGAFNSSINITNGSVFSMKKGDLTVGSSSNIQVTGTSKFIADTMHVAENLSSFKLSVGAKTDKNDDASSFSANNIKFNPYTNSTTTDSFGQFIIETDSKGTVNIGTIDMSDILWKQSSVDTNIWQLHDKSTNYTGSFNIKKIIIGHDGFTFNFVNIKNLKVDLLQFNKNSQWNVTSGGGDFNSTVTFKNVAFTANTDEKDPDDKPNENRYKVTSNFKNINFNVSDTLKFTNTKYLDMNFTNSTVDINKLDHSTDILTANFTGDSSSKITFKNLDLNRSASTDAHSLSISGFKSFEVKDTLYWNGDLTVKKANVSIFDWNGGNATLTLQDHADVKFTDASSVNLDPDHHVSVDATSTLELLGKQVFLYNKTDDADEDAMIAKIIFDNAGKVVIGGTANSVGTVNNTASTSILQVKPDESNEGKIQNVNNTAGATTELYDRAYVQTINNKDNSKIVIKGSAKIDTLNQTDKDASLVFDVGSLTDYGSLYLTNSPDSNWNKNMKVNFSNTSIFKPGAVNKFVVLKTKDKNGPGVTEDEIKGMNDKNNLVMPIWLISHAGIDTDDITGEQDVWVNIQRLTDYKNLIRFAGESDHNIQEIATAIDGVVANNAVTDNLIDVINSLDYNSSVGSICSSHFDVDTLRQKIYLAHNGDKGAAKELAEYDCLGGLVNNIASLSPINNTVFVNISHNVASKALDILGEESNSYNGVGDAYFWSHNYLSYETLDSKDYVYGYKGFSNLFQAGFTGSYINNVNVTASAGLNISSLDGNLDKYTTAAVSTNLAGAISYVGSSYFASFSGLYQLTDFSNTRHVDFMNNDYVVNKNTKVSSNNLVHELLLKGEVGTEVSFADDFYLDPSIFVSGGSILGNEFTESGSSAAYTQKLFFGSVAEAGFGANISHETLMASFLGIHDLFFKFNTGANLVYRYLTDIDTKVEFVGSGVDMTLYGANYSGALAKGSLTFAFYKGNYEFDISSAANIGLENYQSYSLGLTYKYLF